MVSAGADAEIKNASITSIVNGSTGAVPDADKPTLEGNDMNKRVAAASSIVAVLIAVVAAPAGAQKQPSGATGATYNWLHPKLGIVKVDRATNAMVRPTRASDEKADASARPMQRKYWLDPKGNLRVLNTPERSPANDVAAESNR